MRENSFMKKVIRLAATAFMLAMLCGMTAFAADGYPLQSGKTIAVSYKNTQQMTYHKISVPGNGYIYLTGLKMSPYKVQLGLYVQIYNSGKKAISEQVYLSSYDEFTTVFALKKGIYYVGVKDDCPLGYAYGLQYKYSGVKEKSGVSKKKAVTVKKNKTIKGTVAVGESGSKADWYKIKVTKKQKLTLYLMAMGDANLSFTVYGPSYKRGTYVNLKNNKMTAYSQNFAGKATKISKGTYYIKVSRNSYNKKSALSAMYTLKWK